jgi:hypothetical protein
MGVYRCHSERFGIIMAAMEASMKQKGEFQQFPFWRVSRFFRRCFQTMPGPPSIPLALLMAASAAAQSSAPELKIAGKPDGVAVSWPLTAFYYVLETKTNLSSSVAWTNSTTASKVIASSCWVGGFPALTTNVSEDEILAALPATNVKQFFRLKSPMFIPIFSFAVFYLGQMEFTTCSTMTINGPIHANGPICTGSGSNLTFTDTITTSSTISSPSRNGSSPPFAFVGDYNGRPAHITNVPPLVWSVIGTNDPHMIIEQPPDGEDPHSTLGQLRKYIMAQVILTVSNTSVMVKLQSWGLDPSPIILTFTNATATISDSLPFLTLTNVFFDQREDKTNITTQIDIGRYARWISTNMAVLSKTSYPLNLYVADNRTTTTNQLAVVRLTNGIAPPCNDGMGFTLITPNPLYVWGNYNQTNSAYLGSTNTSSGTVPCSLISDALTILSSNWRDSKSTGSYTLRKAASTTVNAAILTGIVPSTGTGDTQFSGGVQNLPRLLEDWTGSALWLNTSLVCFYNSTRATGLFKNPGVGGLTYYAPPQRFFNLDQNFAHLGLPPGTILLEIEAPAN